LPSRSFCILISIDLFTFPLDLNTPHKIPIRELLVNSSHGCLILFGQGTT